MNPAQAAGDVHPAIRIGTAAWGLPKHLDGLFGPGDSILQRYATRFDAVEINSSFYRPHRPRTYARWAASVPERFRFAVKMPKAVTHERRLVECEALLRAFLDQVAFLGGRLGPLLIQLPPSLGFDEAGAGAFLALLREQFGGLVVCEPRHAGWFGPAATSLLVHWRIARVAADPAPVPGAGEPGGWSGVRYHRLHGAPRIYYSAYPPAVLDALGERLRAGSTQETWCIFDNTALGAATEDALRLRDGLTCSPNDA